MKHAAGEGRSPAAPVRRAGSPRDFDRSHAGQATAITT
jgi:hypothetical protein